MTIVPPTQPVAQTDSDLTLIVGAGFVGLFTALHLRHRGYAHPIVLVDPQSQFVFKPLLYESLTAELQPDQVFPSYAELLTGSKIVFVRDLVTQIDLQQRYVETTSGQRFNYRYLVLAVGSKQGYLGTEGAEKYAYAFRTQADAERLSKHLRDCLKRASQMKNSIERQKLLTVAIVGAGPEGVELAATLADLLPQWYTDLGGDLDDLRLVLINHGKEILEGDINSHLQPTALTALQQRSMPVELLLGKGVKSVSPDGATYQDRSKDQPQALATATTIWTAGTAVNPVVKQLAIPDDRRDKHGLLLVTPTLQLIDFPEVFAGGDCATVGEQSLPATAQVAYQQGAGIADNLVAIAAGNPPQPVQVNLRGTLMKLGIGVGVANIFDRVQVDGKAGDLIRNATYLEMLPTPIHNFKATAEWIEDEIFDRHSAAAGLTNRQEYANPNVRAAVLWVVSGVAVATVIIGGIFTVQRLPNWKPMPTATHRSN